MNNVIYSRTDNVLRVVDKGIYKLRIRFKDNKIYGVSAISYKETINRRYLYFNYTEQNLPFFFEYRNCDNNTTHGILMYNNNESIYVKYRNKRITDKLHKVAIDEAVKLVDYCIYIDARHYIIDLLEEVQRIMTDHTTSNLMHINLL